jgi:hypothetical protein
MLHFYSLTLLPFAVCVLLTVWHLLLTNWSRYPYKKSSSFSCSSSSHWQFWYHCPFCDYRNRSVHRRQCLHKSLRPCGLYFSSFRGRRLAGILRICCIHLNWQFWISSNISCIRQQFLNSSLLILSRKVTAAWDLMNFICELLILFLCFGRSVQHSLP